MKCRDRIPARVIGSRNGGVAPRHKVPWDSCSNDSFRLFPDKYRLLAGGVDNSYIVDTEVVAGSIPALGASFCSSVDRAPDLLSTCSPAN